MNALKISLRIGMFAALVGAAVTAKATVLTFEGTVTNDPIPTNWASNVSADAAGINISNGATPNVGLEWAIGPGVSKEERWDYYNDGEWQGVGQLNDFDTGVGHYITFTPETGFLVIVDSFVFDDYVGWGEPSNDFTWTLYQDSTNGTVIATGNETTTDGENLTVNTGMTSGYAGPVVLEFVNNVLGATGDDQALDDITFRQEEVPFAGPATILEISPGPGSTMRVVIDIPEGPERYWPEAKQDLVTGAWTNVAHSVDGAPPWFVTNLSYVVEYDTSHTNGLGEFTHEVIYVDSSDAKKFFRVPGE